MKQIFESATLKLTGWYLLVLACISIMFSIAVYQVSIGELEHRLINYENRADQLWQPLPSRALAPDRLRSAELDESRASIIIILIYTNLVVLILGGVVSYLFARRTLAPVEAAHEQQARFISDASHELRTPLAAMTTELEAALRDPSLSKKEMHELLDSNLEEVRRLTKLSNTLLALSVRDGSLDTAAFSLLDSMKAVAKRLGAETRVDYTESATTTVLAHQQSIEELMTILLDNALKYSTPDSRIAIAITSRGQRVTYSITNKGQGIREDDLPRIFDRFYRADSSRSQTAGHGLGLALAKQISDIHQAGLMVKTVRPGITEFSFSLPAAKSEKSSAFSDSSQQNK